MYEAAVAQGRPEECLDRPYLSKIADMANEAERAASYIQDFIARCRGGGSLANSATQGMVSPVPSGHFGELDRLGNALGQLDALARELQTIG